MKWFGESWQAPINNDSEMVQQVEVPKGAWCAKCEDIITPRDQGVIIPVYTEWTDDDDNEHYELSNEWVYHLDCWMAVMLGNAWFGRYIKQTNVLEAADG